VAGWLTAGSGRILNRPAWTALALNNWESNGMRSSLQIARLSGAIVVPSRMGYFPLYHPAPDSPRWERHQAGEANRGRRADGHFLWPPLEENRWRKGGANVNERLPAITIDEDAGDSTVRFFGFAQMERTFAMGRVTHRKAAGVLRRTHPDSLLQRAGAAGDGGCGGPG